MRVWAAKYANSGDIGKTFETEEEAQTWVDEIKALEHPFYAYLRVAEVEIVYVVLELYEIRQVFRYRHDAEQYIKGNIHMWIREKELLG